MADIIRYPEYHVYRGLQKPLEMFGMRGRYIYWAAGTIGGAILAFFACYILSGFLLAVIVTAVILAIGGGLIAIKQHLGLHSKKAPKGIFIVAKLWEGYRHIDDNQQ